MKTTPTVLAHGNSSVAGAEWFLIGHEDAAVVVVRENDHPASKPDRWTSFAFRPGLDWNEAKSGPVDPVLVGICQQAQPADNLNWNDNRKASDLYWAFKESKG